MNEIKKCNYCGNEITPHMDVYSFTEQVRINMRSVTAQLTEQIYPKEKCRFCFVKFLREIQRVVRRGKYRVKYNCLEKPDGMDFYMWLYEVGRERKVKRDGTQVRRLVLRVSSDLASALRGRATREGTNVSEFVRNLIEEKLKENSRGETV